MAKFLLELVSRLESVQRVAVSLRSEQRLAEGDKRPPCPLYVVGVPRIACLRILPRYEERILHC
jgi:hypothetical protein